MHSEAFKMNLVKERVTSKSVTSSGWTITTTKGPIMGDKDMDECRRSLGDAIALPEMLFDQSRLILHHAASGLTITFNALDALREGLQEGVPPLQVQTAERWRKSREADIQEQQAVQLLYDWTFTTPYTGTVTLGHPAASSTGATTSSSTAAADAADAEGNAASTSNANATSPAGQTGEGDSSASAGVSGRHCESSAPVWQPTTQQIDRSLLMERDPILFFDEVLLYESDLDDNGVCQLSAKLRVMPKCWFVLLRFWLRVDGCMVRLRETRFFCRHDQPERGVEVVREVKHSEGTFPELRAAGAPDRSSPAYADADSAAQALGAVAPVGVKRYELHRLVVVPPPEPESKMQSTPEVDHS